MNFYGIDGDKVGGIIEAHLIAGDLIEIEKFSRKVTEAMTLIEREVKKAGGKVIFQAGDSILFQGDFDSTSCEKLLDLYKQITGRTASMGIGKSTAETYLAVKLAKAQGGGRVINRLPINKISKRTIPMGKILFVFVTSPNVGVYINAMAHAVDMDKVDHFVMIDLLEAPIDKPYKFGDFVNGELWKAISELTAGSFNGKSLVLPPDFRIYEKLKECFGAAKDHRQINYQFLRQDLRSLKQTYGENVIVDLSGVPKRIAIDVLASCLAVGLKNVTTFELKKPLRGVEALYHALSDADYEHVILPNLSPFLEGIESFSARQNRKKLLMVLGALGISAILTLLYQLGRKQLGDNSWLLIAAVVLCDIFGVVLPILDAWGGLRLFRAADQTA
jgi:hypothetical protein